MTPLNSPTDKHHLAWITGASSGLGRAVAIELIRDGWTVAGTARSEESLNTIAEECTDLSGQFVPFAGDISDAAAMKALVARIEGKLGFISLAILNAGTHMPVSVNDFSVSTFETLAQVNLLGTINCFSAVLEPMKARGLGHIAVVSSVAGYNGLPTSAAYGMTKAGLINMCEALKPELDLAGIKFQLVNPGFVRTPLTDLNDFPMPFLMEPEAAARAMVKGLKSRRFEIVFPRRLAWGLKLLGFLPYPLFFSATKRLLPKSP